MIPLTPHVHRRATGGSRLSVELMRRCIACMILMAMTSHANAPGFTRVQWADLLRARLPNLICSEHWYVRQCFSVGASECESAVMSGFDGCLQQYSDIMPLEIRSKEESAAWGKTITSCLGVRFEQKMKQHKKSAAQCTNPGIWSSTGDNLILRRKVSIGVFTEPSVSGPILLC
jgi:hypothetical protein